MGSPATAVPPWLYVSFAVVNLAVAAYCLALLVAAVGTRRASGRDVDVSHLFMGVAMAGMFEPGLAFGAGGVWEGIFAGLMVWFIVRSVQSVLAVGLHLPHNAVHAAMCLAMLLMFRYPMGTGAGPSHAARLDPGLGLLLAVSFLGSAVFTLASPNKGVSHHGSHPRVYAMATAATPATAPVAAAPSGGLEAVVAVPWLEDLSHVVMCIAMGFMLVLTL